MASSADPTIAFESYDAMDPGYYYEVGAKSFWIRREDGCYISMPRQDFETYLATSCHLAPFRDKASGQKVNPVRDAIRDCVTNRRVAWAGRLAGWKRGPHRIAGADILVTESPDLIDPVAGDWKLLDQFLSGLLVSQDIDGKTIDQRPYLYGWLKTTLEALYAGTPTQGLAMVFAAERGTGKTLLKEFIRKMFGEREVYPWKFLSGQDRFNKTLAESVLWVVDDESFQHKRVDRQHLKGEIKKVTANTRWECRGMHRDGETIESIRRLVICVNVDPDCLSVLPDLDEDVIDKITMLKCEPGAIPWPMDTRTQKKAFFDAIVAELPAFVYWLLNRHTIAPEHRGRFEIIHFQHPLIREELLAISPESDLMEHIERTLFDELHRTWEGSAADLYAVLASDDSPLSHRQRNSLPAAAHIGKRLSKLARRFPGRFEHVRTSKRNFWRIRRDQPGPVEAEEGEWRHD